MTRLCERPGCSESSAVSYWFDAAHRIVSLGVMDEGGGQQHGVLCRRHADSMVVPLGWTLDDRRERVPRLFRLPESLPTPASTGASRRESRPTREEPATLFDGAVRNADPATVAALSGVESTSPDETVAIPWNPRFDTSDDLDGLLAAETELLSRAFGRGRRRPRRR